MDEPRVQPTQRLVIEAEPREPADPEVLDQDIAALEQPAQDGRAVGLLEVEPDAALVPIDREVVGRGPGLARGRRRPDPRRSPAAGRVALGRLDLDDVGAQVAQQHRAVRPGQDGRAIDDAQAGERTRGGWAGTSTDGSGPGPARPTRPASHAHRGSIARSRRVR